MAHSSSPASRARHRAEYVARIDRVLDYVESNLDGDLCLATLARVASFSPFYFHRIFGAIMGETLGQFIQRVRVERAANQLLSNPGKSITEIAFDCGFSGPAPFARAFREAYFMSASEWRGGGHRQHRKIRKENRKNGQANRKAGKEHEAPPGYGGDIDAPPTRKDSMKPNTEKLDATIDVKDLTELHVAYLRHVGPYQGDTKLFEDLFGRLMKWAGPRGLLRFPETKVLAVYHDNPEVTDADKLRTSACITVPADTEVDGAVGKMTIPGGSFAVARFKLRGDQYEAAWNTLMGHWLPESGYQPDDRLCYELFGSHGADDCDALHEVDICMPVRPL